MIHQEVQRTVGLRTLGLMALGCLPSWGGLQGVSAVQEPRDPIGSERPEFYFTRAVYSSYRPGNWSIDYPEADYHFLMGLERLTSVNAYDRDHPVQFSDPRIRNFPFVYAVEVGYMSLTEPEVVGLRDYLLAGGFLVVDDFWGSAEWANFERQMARVFPDRAIEELSMEHPVFHQLYEIEEVLQVPALGRGFRGVTWERDGRIPHVRGISDDNGRLMVLINWNTDLGDAWEHADDPRYPLEYATYAYRMGVNIVLYAMSY